MSDENVSDDADNEKNILKPRKELREIPLKRALKSFVIPHIVKNYEVVALRVLWKRPDFNDMQEMRSKLEAAIKGIKEVGIFISCITAQEERKLKGQQHPEIKTGFSFWVAFEWPEHLIESFEDQICKTIIPIGVDIDQCKSLRARGNSNFNSYFLSHLVTRCHMLSQLVTTSHKFLWK